jgi:hypothetical protein
MYNARIMRSLWMTAAILGLAAVVKHDPAGLPLDKGVRFTENTATIHVGDGLWVGASEAPTTFKIYAIDPATQQVAFEGMGQTAHHRAAPETSEWPDH